MRIDARIIGTALLSFAPCVVAQGTPKCLNRDSTMASASGYRPLVIVNGKVTTDSIPLVVTTSSGFLARGPGELFGITGYRCAACQDKLVPGRLPEFTFMAEPVVESVYGATPVRPGDVIQAVNDQPITTSAGAVQFAQPAPGANTLTVRRGRDRIVLRFDIAASPPCSFSPDTTFHVLGRRSGIANFDTARVSESPSGEPKRRHFQFGVRSVIGGVDTTGARAPIYVIDGVRIEPMSVPTATRYGFAVSCEHGCTKVTNPDGTTFYRYTGPPTINAIRDTSLAARAGLRVGDVIVKVDGLSILSDDAAIRLEQKSTLRVTVLRDGKEVGVVLQAPK